MSNVVLKVEHVYKTYQLGAIGTGTLSHDLNRWYHKLRNNEDKFQPIHSTTNNESFIHALHNVSFEVQEGQVFGIIGRNGAGKSTLLKILSKITAPTKGNIYIKGKISSLLEVGTGFHPEMTGRENIFMNGAILGMNEAEIKSKLDEIIDFSGVEKFIDTPVKRYSSGMYLKLAFSVAAHLEPDILILDEVLAVGDAEFQKKCLGKMKDVSSSGRTVLFVSHNMAAIQSITQHCMIMEKGQIKFSGPTQEAVAIYMKGVNDLTNYKAFETPTIQYQQFVVSAIGVKATTKNYADAITREAAIDFVFEYNNQNQDEVFDFTIRVKASDGQYVFTASSLNEPNQVIVKGNHQLAMQIPAYFFNYDTYYIDFLLVVNKKKAVLIENDLLSFTVNAEQKKLGEWMGKTPGYLYPNFNWSKL